MMKKCERFEKFTDQRYYCEFCGCDFCYDCTQRDAHVQTFDLGDKMNCLKLHKEFEYEIDNLDANNKNIEEANLVKPLDTKDNYDIEETSEFLTLTPKKKNECENCNK